MNDATATMQTLTAALIGAWTLVSYVSRSDGRTSESFGPHPHGSAMFDASGRFSIIVVRADLAPFAVSSRDGGTHEENAAVVRGSLAYFGTYTVEAARRELIFDIRGATLPNWIGTRQRRGVRLGDEGRLVLVNPVASGGGIAEITWDPATRP